MSDSDDLFAKLEASVSELKKVAKTSRSAKPEKNRLAANGGMAVSASDHPVRSTAKSMPQSAPKSIGGFDKGEGYTAADIEVLEGLEPVRRRPGMYIGGTDTTAMHHLFAEVIDNCMDEAVAGHATWIEVHLGEDGFLTVMIKPPRS